MKKSSLDMLLLLASAFKKPQLAGLIRDLRGLSAAEIDGLTSSLEDFRSSLADKAAEAIGAEIAATQARRGTQEEVGYILLTRLKLRPAVATKHLSAQLALLGRDVQEPARPTKASFQSWLATLCDTFPREEVMSATLNVQKQLGDSA